MEDINNQIASIILAGGRGTRLHPLTLNHCKPAVAYGGKYRLIDIPISNSINSGIKHILILAQYLTTELEGHLQKSYQFDTFSFGKMQFISPEEKNDGTRVWFDGTADAVRKAMPYLEEMSVEYFLILSGDQLYNIDFSHMLEFTKETDSDLTIATLEVEEKDAHRLGILKINEEKKITDFIEKPENKERLDPFRIPKNLVKNNKEFLGSMGIYIFKKEALFSLLLEDHREDFGKHLIPTQIKKGKTAAFIYDGYWEDIGTIQSFYNANLCLNDPHFSLDLYNDQKPIYTTPCFLPGPKINNTKITNSIICDGSLVEGKEVTNSIVGVRSHIGKNTVIQNSILFGNHLYRNPLHGKVSLIDRANIGKNCLIQKAIIDEDVQIGDNVKLINEKNLSHYDGDGIYIRDGIIVVAAKTTIKNGFIL